MITTTPSPQQEKAYAPTAAPVCAQTGTDPRRRPFDSVAGQRPRSSRVEIRSTSDIVTARQRGRMLALELGFTGADVTVIAAAISEVARNIVEHAEAGEMIFAETPQPGRTGLVIIAHDEGPGILDAERVVEFGRGARDGLAVGLPGVRLLMDDFEIESTIGSGTTVTMTKWLR
jgi:serine/threonine-protein kinase RsbT